MSRLNPIDPANAQGKAKDLLNGVQQALGATPNIFTTMANAPAALESYLNFSGALKGGALSAQLAEQIALTTAGQNGCSYCASAHTFLGGKAGLETDELSLNLTGKASDAKTQAALTFAIQLVEKRGRVSEEDVTAVREAGYSDEEIVEILAHVSLNIFTNYFNEAFKTDIDFPEVSAENVRQAA